MARYRHSIATWLGMLASRVDSSAGESSNSNSNGSVSGSVSVSVDPTGHQQFADELTSILHTKENECTSALGVSMAFSLVYPGSTGEGMEQIRDAMRYPSDEDEDSSNMELVWEETTRRMLDASSGQCVDGPYNGICYAAAPLLQIANSIWFDDGDTLHPDYASVVGSYAKQIDFEADDSPVIVNEWVDNSTNGLIDSIVPEDRPLYPPYVLLAINSIYLKARWEEQFRESKTNLDSFYVSSTSSNTEASKAHFMNKVEYFDYSHEMLEGYQVIDLPFAESQMSMVFVLPMTDDDADAFVSSTELLSALDGLKKTRVALSVPKFKFESVYNDDLKDALIRTGITQPFDDGSGALCGIFQDDTDCEQLIIDRVIQKTVIDVNEDGVEAAAVTMVGMGVTSVEPPETNDPILMVLDHPFQFFIHDKSEGLVLFEGRLGKPEIPETDPEVPLLDALHADDDFWQSAFFVDPVQPPPVATITDTGSTITSNGDLEPIDPAEHQEFADKLTTILYANENECTSSLGVSMAFSLVWPGSTGDGIVQIRDTFGYPSSGPNTQLVWEKTSRRMISASSGQCVGGEWNGVCNSNAPLLQIANSVWFDDGDALHPDYESVVGSYYAKQIDFEADDSPVIVNEWVSNSTNGLIDSIVPEDKPLFPPYVLIAVNSIYLKASWMYQFQESNTKLDPFYASASRNTKVSEEAHFMNMVEYFSYSDNALPGYQVIDLPFAESQMSMIFVLPTSEDAGEVPSTELISALGDLRRTRIALSAPKFKFESEYDDSLKDALKQMGMEAPFVEGSGALCGLFENDTDCERIVIDKVIQKTVIDVNEDGVEAAAVTAVMAVGLSLDMTEPIPMILNHPFQFFIFDKLEELMLFEGRLGKPEAPEGEPQQSSSPTFSPKEVIESGTTVPISASGSSTSPPTTSSPTQSSESGTTTAPTKASGSTTTSPTKAPVTPPAPPDSSTEPDGTSSGHIMSASKLCFSLGASILLAPTFIFIQ